MENCSEFNCRNRATQILQLNAGRKLYCDHHFRNKMQILKPQRSSLFVSQSIMDLKHIVLETSSRIVLESANTIKAVQLKTQADLQVLSKFLKTSISQLSSLNARSSTIIQDFQKILNEEPHFLIHFQELGKKIKVFDNNMKIQIRPNNGPVQDVRPQDMNQPKPEKKIIIPKLENKYEETKTDLVSIPLKITPTKKLYDELTETVSMPIRIPKINKINEELQRDCFTLPIKPNLDKKTYYIETKNGLQTIPNSIVEQIVEARKRNLNSLEIYNNGKVTSVVDLVNWRSYKISSSGQRESFSYKIHPPNT